MIKDDIRFFNKKKSKDLYRKILSEIEPGYLKCKECSDVVYHQSSFFRISKQNIIYIEKKSHRLFKKIYDKEYYLVVCEDCLKKKFPEYRNRIFNTMNHITKYAFDIPDDIYEKWKKENIGVTLHRLISLYGDNDGKKRWDKYCKRQSETNKFEYKKYKYGWNKEDFESYNKSRSVTLSNLIKKHGENKGLKIWQDYIEKQILTKSKEYFINKYGEDKWNELNKKKAQTLENFIKRYGDKRAFEKFDDYMRMRISFPASKSSQIYFKTLDNVLGKKYTTYFYEKNGKEFGKLLSTGRYVYLDYYIKELNLDIEFNGDIFHANPNIFKSDDKPNPFNNETANEIWEKDEEKIKLLEREHNIKTITIWESNLPNLDEILKIIEDYEK